MKLAPKDQKQAAKYAAVLGIILAIVCNSVPPEYRAVCHALAQVCTGGLI